MNKPKEILLEPDYSKSIIFSTMCLFISAIFIYSGFVYTGIIVIFILYFVLSAELKFISFLQKGIEIRYPLRFGFRKFFPIDTILELKTLKGEMNQATVTKLKTKSRKVTLNELSDEQLSAIKEMYSAYKIIYTWQSAFKGDRPIKRKIDKPNIPGWRKEK